MGLKFAAEKRRISSRIRAQFSHVFLLGFLLVSFSAQSYVKFSSDPTEGWESILEQSGVERTYLVQQGDTLYGISKTLFGDAEFWPKVWSINSNITNPHLIERNQVIYFSGGTVVVPPRFGMDIIKSQSYVYGTGLVEPLLPPEPLTKGAIEIPPAFGNYFKAGTNEAEETQLLKSISADKRAALDQKREVEITSEVVSKKPFSVGRITRIQSRALSAGVGSLVSVSIKGGNVDALQRFNLFKYTSGGLFSGNKDLSVDLVEWLGSLEILRQIDDDEYVARIREANDMVLVGTEFSTAGITKVSLPGKTGSVTGIKQNSKVKIIGANKVEDILIIGENEVVYLRGGSKQGVEPGQVYPIFNNFGLGIIGEKSKFIQKSIGYVKIAKVTKRYSTGVVFNLSSEASSGNRLGVER